MSSAIRYTPQQVAELLGQPWPTDQQAAIIAAPMEPMLVVAGAGSGKTETMSGRVIWLVANGFVRPEEILGLTFTRKAAAELASRIRGRLAQLSQRGLAAPADTDEIIGEPTVSTYNSYAARIVAEHGLRSGFEPSTRLLTEAVTWQLADQVVRTYDGDMSAVDFAPSTVTGAVLDLAGQLAEHLRQPAELSDWTTKFIGHIESIPRAKGQRSRGDLYARVADILQCQRARLQLLPLVERYTERKRAAEAMDFGDQMSRAAVVARDHREVGGIERAKFKIVLLDEYQDTSHAQLTLLTSLYGGGHPVVAVGDPCQSIYGWRGASAGNLARFPLHFRRRNGSPASVAALTVSWRNDEAILDLANTVSEPLRDTGALVSVPELQPGPAGIGEGVVRCALHSTVDDEATWIAARIAEVWSDDPDKPMTAAVLARKRSQFDQLAVALRAAGLPVEVVGIGGLLETPEVQEIVATLRAISDPTAGDALMRLLTGARWRLGPRDLAALGDRASALVRQRQESVEGDATSVRIATEDRTTDVVDERSVIEALDDLGPPDGFSPAGYARLSALRDELRALRNRIATPLPELVAEVERTLGLDIEVTVHRWSQRADARAHLDAFASVAAEFSENTEAATLTAFLAYLKAADDRERGLSPGQVEVQPGAVQILTVHAAKGLEWDVVAVPGLTRAVFPVDSGPADTWAGAMGALPVALRGDAADLPDFTCRDAIDQTEVEESRKRYLEEVAERGLAEERRLAYVALTRARHLVLCSGYWWDSATRPRGPSVFLEEIRDHAKSSTTVHIDHWEEIGEERSNPLAAQVRSAPWPLDPLGEARAVMNDAANQVMASKRRQRAAAKAAATTTDRSTAGRDTPELAASETEEIAAQWAAEAELLLAERGRSRRTDIVDVTLPMHMSVSQLVMLRRDPHELARTIRRPLPFAPAPLARRGTAFHAWLERRFGAQQLLDLDELPGAADADAAADADLERLREAFLRSEWAHRVPANVEVPFATVVAGVVIRGRMDAVFADRDDDGSPLWDVVDWKTGSPPSGEGAEAAAVQLAAYRLAWADLAGVPVDRVRAAFHYVGANRTVRPVDLLDSAGLAALLAELPILGR